MEKEKKKSAQVQIDFEADVEEEKKLNFYWRSEGFYFYKSRIVFGWSEVRKSGPVRHEEDAFYSLRWRNSSPDLLRLFLLHYECRSKQKHETSIVGR